MKKASCITYITQETSMANTVRHYIKIYVKTL